MKRVTSWFVILLLTLLPFQGFAQNEAAHFGMTASAVVGLAPGSVRQTIEFGPDPVELTFRHCQDYARVTHRHWIAKMFGAHDKHWIDSEACANDPSTVFNHQFTHNIVTNAGFDVISKQISATATQPAACNYIAVTNTAITPAAGDTSLTGEIDNTNGLGRAQGTFAHSDGTKVFTVTKVFTAGGTVASQATGLFNAASSVTLCADATYTQVTVNSGDTLTVTWTVTLS